MWVGHDPSAITVESIESRPRGNAEAKRGVIESLTLNQLPCAALGRPTCSGTDDSAGRWRTVTTFCIGYRQTLGAPYTSQEGEVNATAAIEDNHAVKPRQRRTDLSELWKLIPYPSF